MPSQRHHFPRPHPSQDCYGHTASVYQSTEAADWFPEVSNHGGLVGCCTLTIAESYHHLDSIQNGKRPELGRQIVST